MALFNRRTGRLPPYARKSNSRHRAPVKTKRRPQGKRPVRPKAFNVQGRSRNGGGKRPRQIKGKYFVTVV